MLLRSWIRDTWLRILVFRSCSSHFFGGYFHICKWKHKPHDSFVSCFPLNETFYSFAVQRLSDIFRKFPVKIEWWCLSLVILLASAPLRAFYREFSRKTPNLKVGQLWTFYLFNFFIHTFFVFKGVCSLL